MTHHASCACGALSLTCAGTPVKVSLCHCLACQRRTGGPFGVAAFFPAAAVTVSGDSTRYSRPSDSGFDISFHFCPTCGTTLFWYPQRLPDLCAIALGGFADPGFPGPEQEVHTEHRHPWVPPLAP